MASEPLEAILKRVGEKSRLLTERYRVTVGERDAALDRIATLEKELAGLRLDNERMTVELEFMRVSSVVAPTADRVADTRRLLQQLVKDVDRCIADLKE